MLKIFRQKLNRNSISTRPHIRTTIVFEFTLALQEADVNGIRCFKFKSLGVAIKRGGQVTHVRVVHADTDYARAKTPAAACISLKFM